MLQSLKLYIPFWLNLYALNPFNDYLFFTLHSILVKSILMTQEDFIANENGTIFLYINTGDSGCPGTIDVNYCPMCGRKLVEE